MIMNVGRAPPDKRTGARHREETPMKVVDAIAEILKASGKAFDNLITSEDEDDYYDKL